ncbi:hypothetical protein AB0P21_15070 [Kribbella sp. NPDC056861]|uniref:hypothetical protein n=1 Tax=Kribbella sp. NPDC056861 TaxID=3154857 RepID=UPI00341B8BC5
MTAHRNDVNREPLPAEAGETDPLGPIRPPMRSRIGSRALALVGAASVAALAVHVIVDGCSTDTSISNPG